MKPKVLGAIICVMIMVACPLVAVAADSEAADEVDSSALIKLSGLQKSQVSAIFDVKEQNYMDKAIFVKVAEAIGLNYYGIENNSKFDSEMIGFTYEAGKKLTLSGDKKTATDKSFMKISCDTFSFKFTINTKEKVKVIGSTSLYAGEGMSKMLEKFGQIELKEGDTVQVKGSMTFISTVEKEYKDVFQAVGGGYYPTVSNETTKTKQIHDVTVTIANNSSVKDKFDGGDEFKIESKYDFVNGSKTDYEQGMNEMVTSSVSSSSNSSGTKEIDGSKYSYGLVNGYSRTVGPTISSGPQALQIDKEVNYYDLSYMRPYYERYYEEANDKIKAAVYGNNGTATTDSSKFTETYNKVASDVNTSGSSDNTMLIIGIVVAVVIVLALVALWYFKFRSPPASKTEDTPVQPEEPKNENQ